MNAPQSGARYEPEPEDVDPPVTPVAPPRQPNARASLTISADAKVMLTISADGVLGLGPDVVQDDAARSFLDAVERVLERRVTGVERPEIATCAWGTAGCRAEHPVEGETPCWVEASTPASETERVYRAIGGWVAKMRERGVEKLDGMAARYHLGLTIKTLLAEEQAKPR